MNGQWHYLEWSESHRNALWDFYAQWTPAQNRYFSRQVGQGVFRFLQRATDLGGHVLDYGCGPGHLVRLLVQNRVFASGADTSPDSIRLLERDLQNNPHWKGGAVLDRPGSLPYADGTFSLVICLETFEHMDEEAQENLLPELHRVLAPGGCLFATVPEKEDLGAAMVFCPESRAVFHPWQHVRSLGHEDLALAFESHGFTTILHGATSFRAWQSPRPAAIRDYSLADVARLLRGAWGDLADRLGIPGSPAGGRHLNMKVGEGENAFCLARKPGP
ncbi:MAG: hypothetical protein Kow00129_08110 [Thermoleophilia bacterium]